MENAAKVKPSGWWYVFAGALAVIGISVAAYSLISLFAGLFGKISSMQRVVVPGQKDLNLSQPGQYTIFHEYNSTLDGKVYSSNPANQLQGMTFKVISLATSKEVPITPATVKSTYTANGSSGLAILHFTIDQPGEYRLTATSSESSKEQAVVAVGEDIFNAGFLSRIIAVPCVTGPCIVGAIVVFIVTIIRRSSFKRRMSTATPPPIH